MARIICTVSAMWLAATSAAAPTHYAANDAGTIYGGAIHDRDWGRPLAAGDLDGDGYDDLIVAASESWGGVTSQVHIVRGGPDAGRRGAVDLAGGGVDQVIFGAQVDDNLGSSITTGDLNADGVADLLLSASGADYGGRAGAGIAYVLYGGADFFASPARNLNSPSAWDVRLIGPAVGGDLGGALTFGGGDTHATAIGNLNGDPYGDLVLGVHLADGNATNATNAGRVYVVFGQPFESGTTLDLASNRDYDVVIYGDDELDEMGDYVLTGDVTGDGLDELIIPNHYASQRLFDSEGAVHIFRGRETWATGYNLGASPADITLLGSRKNDNLGESAAVGDFNNDGIIDLATAAPGADDGPLDVQIGEGFVYGILGSADFQHGTHLIDFATATPDFLMIGDEDKGLGAELSAADFDGDGFTDIAASERFGGPQTNGVVEILTGRTFDGNPVFRASLDTDVRILGDPQDRIGFSLGSSDMNGNGVFEVLFGTPFNNNDAGTAWVFQLILETDFDADGDVDGDDFLIWQSAFGNDADGDADFDGDTDGDDFLVWQIQFGTSLGVASTAVPETAAGSLLIMSLMTMLGANPRPQIPSPPQRRRKW